MATARPDRFYTERVRGGRWSPRHDDMTHAPGHHGHDHQACHGHAHGHGLAAGELDRAMAWGVGLNLAFVAIEAAAGIIPGAACRKRRRMGVPEV